MLLHTIRESKTAKITALVLVFELIAQLMGPIKGFALTTGPTQPEMTSFEPVGTSEMVNVFTGDFNYNIPLLDVGGYPINLSYNSGITTDQEASWVGLGWNINPGAINRSMRGLPDDFNGDEVIKRFNMKPNRTYGASGAFGAELFGIDGFNVSYGISVNYNNYKGVGFEQSLNMSFSSAAGSKGSFTGGLGVTSGNEGLDVRPSLSFSGEIKKIDNRDNLNGRATLGLSMNSRSGLKQLSLNASVSETAKGKRVHPNASRIGKVGRNTYTSSVNGGSALDFASSTYTPQVSMPMVNTSLAFSLKTGGTLFGADGTFDISGYYSEQRLDRSTITSPAYGYLNAENGGYNGSAMLDFNREKDGSFTESTPALPLTNFTYDVYSVNGQGIGGTYRPFRSDMGFVFDPDGRTYSNSSNLGTEVGVGNAVHGGVDVSITNVNTTSGAWIMDNQAAGQLRFKGYNGSTPLYEPYYFKEAGEKSVDPDVAPVNGFYETMGADQPVRVKLQHTGGLNVEAQASLVRPNGTTIGLGSGNKTRSERQRRNQVITTLSVDEASRYGLQRSFYSSGISAAAKKHHIGELTTLRSDGSRYVFGIPAYNTLQQEATFNVQTRPLNADKSIVTYESGDNSTGNQLGIDNYFSEVETPGYAHTYLLTAVLSPDYVDYDNVEGPSEGDLGSYTRINYTKAVNNFKWRTPLGDKAANYNEGMKSLPEDDKGSYVYGEKEIWYVSSIETKTYVAVFTLADREDGLGVLDKNGAKNESTGSKLKLLSKITLYSKPDYDLNGVNAEAIKVVHFKYSYRLCPTLPNRISGVGSNTGTGKLTLEEVSFSYRNSYKAKLSAYKFLYADPNHGNTNNNSLSSTYNPSYNPKSNDRWGSYKPNLSNSGTSATAVLSCSEYPYVDQNAATATQYANAWNLTRIELPSGGSIDVDYEADDYAYVQDKPAKEMFKVIDFRLQSPTSSLPDPSAVLITNPSTITPKNISEGSATATSDNYFLYFQLKQPITSGTPTVAASKILNDYLGGRMENVYFRFLTDITKYGDYEYVSGYLDLDDQTTAIGVVGTAAPYQYAWLKIKKVNIGDREGSMEINPICKAAWQFGRLQLPRKVWELPDPQSSAIDQVAVALTNASLITNIVEFFKGPNKTLRDKGFAQRAMMNKSWIALQTPDGIKYGGGSRVKRIAINDNWNTLANPTNDPVLPSSLDAKYGQEYTYRVFDQANQRTISSGVASYEPQLGGDENPFHHSPTFLTEEKLLVPDDESYLEPPFGESFFPSPGVGYSRVEVRSLTPTTASQHGTGYTVQEFYTAKDFPTITRVGELDVEHRKTVPILSFLRITMKDYLTASQGFVVELNDMHGKPKATTVYAEDQVAPISEVKYYYKTDPNNAKHLSNEVSAISKTGAVNATATIGLDYDFVADFREQRTEMKSGGVNANLASFLAGIFPLVIPTIIPSWSSEDTRFRSAVITKVVNRSGILIRTEARDAGSTAITENLAWDEQTGEQLLTKTYTNYDDAVYNFNYPAHWAYDRMGQAYKNVAVKFQNVTIAAGGVATITNAQSYFVPGDEVAVEAGGQGVKAWVCSVNTGSIKLIDANGVDISTSWSGSSIKVLRSGRRNMQAVSVGSVTLRDNPIQTGTLVLASDKVLSAGAVEFAEHWTVAPGKGQTTTCLCTPTTVGTDLGNMLTTLENNGLLLINNATLKNGNSYSNGYTSSINNILGNPNFVNWNVPGATNTNTLLANFAGTNANVNPLDCEITLTLSSSTWATALAVSGAALSNFTPTSNAGCNAATDSFTMQLSQGPFPSITVMGTVCFPIGNCNGGTSCGVQAGNVVNPYFQNILGNWRPLRNQTYLSDRLQDPLAISSNANVSPRTEGFFRTPGAPSDFMPFWKPNNGNDWIQDATYWTWAQEITKYTPFGNEVENRDALNRYSCAVFGYNNTLPLLVASNSRHQNVGYDGFEDYDYITDDCRQLHFSFSGATVVGTPAKDRNQAHTGLYSMQIPTSSSLTMIRQLAPGLTNKSAITCPYTIAAGDLNGVFAPYTGGGTTTYVLNYWVKQALSASTVAINYPNPEVVVTIPSNDNITNARIRPLTLVQKSPVIEGWQQYQYTFTINNGATGAIEIKLNNNNTNANQTVWFDDIRIHPFDASMMSYVYHPVNQRFISQLDENNYATIYEYDEEGALIRVKKETERGIMTLKEARNNSSHQ